MLLTIILCLHQSFEIIRSSSLFLATNPLYHAFPVHAVKTHRKKRSIDISLRLVTTATDKVVWCDVMLGYYY